VNFVLLVCAAKALKMRISRKKLAYILFFSLLHLIVIATSFYFLCTSPSAGITTVWDKTLGRWKVESAEHWSLLRKGDLIKKIGVVEIGYPDLLNQMYYLRSRSEILAWFDARKELYRQLRKENVLFLIIRDSKENTVTLHLRKTGCPFSSPVLIFYYLNSFLFLLVGFVVISKKGDNPERFLLFSFCSWFSISSITMMAFSSPKISMEPHFEFLITLVNAASIVPFGFMQMLHFSLLAPKKSSILSRVPRLPLIGSVAGLAVLSSLEPSLLFSAFCLAFGLNLAATAHSYFTSGNSVEKSQVKWMIAGYFGVLPLIIFTVIPVMISGEEIVKPEISTAATTILPLCMAFSIHRYRLIGINDLLQGTFVYAAAIVLVVGLDIFLISALSSSFASQLDPHPARKVLLSLAITIAVYAMIRDKLWFCLNKTFGKRPDKEGHIVLAFTGEASGKPPQAIAEVFENSIRNAFRPKTLERLTRENDEASVAAFDGRTKPVLLWESDLGNVPHLRDALLALPLGQEDRVDHVLLLGELPTGKLYGSYEMGILNSLLMQARLLYANAQLYDENLRYCRAILSEEKRHVSEKEIILRDLHDGIGGIVTNIGLLSDVAKKSCSVDDRQSFLSTISKLSRECLTEIHTIMHSLDDSNLTWEGLVADFRNLGANMIEANEMAFNMETSLSRERHRLGSLLYLNLLRIYRECLTNIVKHSQAHRVQVCFEIGPGRIVLCVQDDGVGFRESHKPGRGISHMQTRAMDIGGNLSVISGSGVTVRLEI
jgi:signal transduction histidine kinase